jgi:hypothetical protein
MYTIGKKTVYEALKDGDCIHCVSYFPGDVTPHFSSHCRSTLDRGYIFIQEGEEHRKIKLCGLNEVKDLRPPSKRSPKKKKGSDNYTFREYLNKRDLPR